MTEVTPGNWIEVPPRRLGDTRVQRFILCRDGAQRWVDEDQWERLSPQNVERLRLGIDYHNLRLLCNAGLVETRRPVPRATSFSVESFFAHVDRVDAAVAAGQEFWVGERLQALRDARRKYVRWANRDTSLAARRKESRGEPRTARRPGGPPSSAVQTPSTAS